MLIYTHRIASITFRGETDVPIPHLAEDPFNRFRIDDGASDVRYQFCQLNPDLPPSPPLNAEERERIVRTFLFPQRWLHESALNSPQVRSILLRCLETPELVHLGLRWGKVLIRNFARNELYFFYPPERRDHFARPIMQASYRNLLAPLLPNFSAMLIHASGIIRHGSALLFLAPDEGGKSSVAKQFKGGQVLNDDQVVLRRENNVIHAHATPLGPITCGPQSARLGGIFLLNKSPRFELTPIPANQVLRYLWKEHLHIHAVMPNSVKARAFELLADACHQAPTYQMAFPKNGVDWGAIDTVISQSS